MKIFSMVTAEHETEQWACVTAQFAPMKLTRSSMFLKGGSLIFWMKQFFIV